MTELPLALALTAGMLAAVNPCGFALLPAYLSLLVLGDGTTTRAAAVGRALTATAAMTLGFAVVFAVFGFVIAPGAAQVQQQLPWFTVVFGTLLAAAGAWLLTGRALPSLLPRIRRAPAVTRSVPSMALFGAAYAVASIGCTIAPFLAIVLSAFRSGSAGGGILLFLCYALGMGVITGAAAVAVALTRTAAVGGIRRLRAMAGRLGGALLLVVGGYVAHYGWYEIRVLRGEAVSDPVVDGATAAQRWIAGGLDDAGVPLVAVVFVLLLAAALMPYRRGRSLEGPGTGRGSVGRWHDPARR
ncbi:cytochrome c biogenesis CcdA family protein [Streptomyces sp. NPDC048639]|uniref:cytochrome c biogenesis CcdA family protein n=1 Tax=Streptomyces sp. NPDC048639 TaxID=3365581 RepID=UPI00371BFABB